MDPQVRVCSMDQLLTFLATGASQERVHTEAIDAIGTMASIQLVGCWRLCIESTHATSKVANLTGCPSARKDVSGRVPLVSCPDSQTKCPRQCKAASQKISQFHMPHAAHQRKSP